MSAPSFGPSIGCWLGLSADRTIVAAYIVRRVEDEDSAREFVSDGTDQVVRVGPEVLVRLGDKLHGEDE